MPKLKIVCLSDTHNQLNQIKIPKGDILIVAGDWTYFGHQNELQKFGNHLRKLPHDTKLIIPGNHDITLDEKHTLYHKDAISWIKLDRNTILGINEIVTIRNLRILCVSYINPIGLYNRWGFERDEQAQSDFYNKIKTHDMILEGPVDIVVSHSPPFGIMDEENYGSRPLLEFIQQVRPKYHIFGHCHDGHGKQIIDGITYINSASCTREYKATNKPIVFEIDV